MEPVTAIGAGVLGAILKPVVKDVYDAGKALFSKSPAKVELIAQSVEDLSKVAYKVVLVKTLWNFEREVSLFEFYYPSRVQVKPESEVGVIVNGISDLPNFPRLIIEGTAGQGKSIFLRYLFGALAFKANVQGLLPVFIELRRVSSEHTLYDAIAAGLHAFGLKVQAGDVIDFLATGKVILLLDAFDEVGSDLIDVVVRDVEKISQASDKLKIIITSRPSSALHHSTYFRIFKLDPLQEEDHLPFLQKVCESKTQAVELHNAIQEDQVASLRELLTTPLLMTLLVLLYRSQSTLPTTKTRFYEQLFDVMFFKHDQTKPGFRRARFTDLDELELKRMFEAFCFHAKLDNVQIFSTSVFERVVSEAVNTTGITVGTPAFNRELTKTACLLIEDGLELTFIHKSVAEFYAASFIQRSSDNFTDSFYEEIRREALQADWAAELDYLSQIDKRRYLRKFLIPEADAILKINGLEEPYVATDALSGPFLVSLIKESRVNFSQIGGKFEISLFHWSNSSPNFFAAELLEASSFRLFEWLQELPLVVDYMQNLTQEKENETNILVGDFVADSSLLNEVGKRFYLNAIEKIIDQKRTAEKYLSLEDGKRKLISRLRTRRM